MRSSINCIENTFVMLKPDVISRALVGRVFQRFEDAGLKIVDAKKVDITRDLAYKHYPYIKQWERGVGIKVFEYFGARELNAATLWNTADPVKIGARILHWSREYLINQLVLACCVSGPHAIERVKQIVGDTDPLIAARGTIRGDFCTDSPVHSFSENRAIHNLVHRSSNAEEAKRELAIWFS